MNLYEIADSIRHIAATIDESGEITPETEAQLAGLEMSFEAKVESLCRWRAELDAEANAFLHEAKRLGDRAGVLARRSEWIKEWIRKSMLAAKVTGVDAGFFRVRVQRNGRPTITLIGDAIPDAFQRFVPAKVEFDSQAAYQAWKDGVALPEEIKVECGTHLRIS